MSTVTNYCEFNKTVSKKLVNWVFFCCGLCNDTLQQKFAVWSLKLEVSKKKQLIFFKLQFVFFFDSVNAISSLFDTNFVVFSNDLKRHLANKRKHGSTRTRYPAKPATYFINAIFYINKVEARKYRLFFL